MSRSVKTWGSPFQSGAPLTGVPAEARSQSERMEMVRRMVPLLSRAGSENDRTQRLHGLVLLLPHLSAAAVLNLQLEGAGSVARAS